MEDSFDSSYDFSKPKKKSPRGKDKRSNSNSNSNKDKYDFPAPINTRSVKSKNYSEDSNSGIDKDILFSPTGSEDFDSPIADKSKGKYKSKFDFDEPTVTATTKPTSDYLSNFANTSGDLEDSILGELLGGPKKTKIPTSSPVSATNKSNRPVQMKLDPIDQKSNKSNFSFGNSNSNSNSNNAPADSLTNNSFDDWDADDVLDVDIPMHTTKTVTDSAAPVVTETKKSNTISLQNPMAGKTTDLPKRKGSVDFDDMDDLLNDNLPNSNRNSSTMPSLMQPSRALDPLKRTNSFKAVVSDSPSPPALPRGNRRDFDDSIDVDDRTGPSTEPEKQEKSTKAADSYIPSVYNPSSLSTKSSTKKSDNDGDVGGFIPSFLEPGNRQGRRRRNLDGGVSKSTSALGEEGTGGSLTKLDALDAALGLASTTTAATKKPVDPFSNAEKKLSSISSKAPAFAFDSSDSDDDFSAMRRKKDSASSFKSSIGKTQADTRPNTAPVIAPTASKANQERNANASKVGGDEQGSFHVLPALSRSSSHYNVMDNDKTSSQKKIVSDSEDDLDVSGIVRIDDTIETKIKRSPDKSPSNSKVKKKSNGNSTEELLDMSTDTLNLSKEEFAPQRSSSPTKSKAVGSSSNSMTSSGNSVTKSSTWASKNNIAAVVTNKATTDIVSPRQSISPTARRRPKDTEEVKLSDASQRDASSIGSMHPQQSSSPDWKINESNSKTNSQNLKISLQDSGAFGENSVDGFRRSSLTSPVGQTSLDRDSSIKIRKLQDALEAMSLEKEAIERHLKLEINLLKEQLADGSKEKELMQTRIHQLEDQLVKNGIELIENLDKSVEFKTNTAQSKTLLHLEQEKFLLIQQEQKSENNKLSLMNNNNERTIIQLEAEISRLKDEININALKFHSNLKESRDKHEVELSDMKVKYDEELKTLERRHKDSIDALNKIHNDELEAVKDRNRSGQVFEQVASQIKSTSGSIKLIEEQLNVRYRSIDAAREGQMEARERLLADMEMKAREKAEQAEAETFRLKGILNHMEHVIDNIRSQSTEEKERLRQEQLRLTTLLSSVEAEKKALQQRNSEELAYIKQKSKELELESVRLLEEKRNFFESIASSQRSIDREKAEFETFANHKRRTLESLETQLHDSEMKLKREKEEFFSDKTSFEMRRREAIASIESIESDKRKLFDEQENLRREREQLKSLANEVQQVMNTISEKEKEIEVHSAGLSEREIVLREGYAQMKQSATILSKREAAVQDSIRLLEDKQMSLEAIDEQLFNRKYKLLPHSNRPRDDYEPIPSSYATLERSTLVPSISPNSNQHPFSGGLPRPVSESNNNPTTNSKVRFNEFDSKSIEFEISNEEKWIDKFQQRLSTTYYTAANNTNAVPKELLEAKRVLEKSRSDLDRIASNNLNMNKILHREKEFLKLMQKK